MLGLLRATALIEITAGLILFFAPSKFAEFLFNVSLDSTAALSVARLGGAALLTLAATAWYATSDPNGVAAKGFIKAMIIYNAGAAIVLGIATSQPGSNLVNIWPGVVLHTIMAAWCLMRSVGTRRPA